MRWKIAARSLVRNKRSTLLSVLMIGVSFAAIVLLTAAEYRYLRFWITGAAYSNYFGHVSIYKTGGLERSLVDSSRYLITVEEQRLLLDGLSASPAVAFVGRYLRSPGLIATGCKTLPFIGLGIDLTVEERIHTHPELVRWLNSTDRAPFLKHLADPSFERLANPVAVTAALAAQLGKSKTAEQGPPEARTRVIDCTASGADRLIDNDADVQLMVQDSLGDLSIEDATIAFHHSTGRVFDEDLSVRAPLSLVQKMLGTQGVTYLAVYLRDGLAIDRFIADFKQTLGGRARDFNVYSSIGKDVNEFAYGAILWTLAVELFTELLIAMVVAIVIGNFVAMAIKKRQKEIGTLCAIGFRRGEIDSIFHAESFLATLLGLAFGIGVALLTVHMVNQANIPFRAPGIPGEGFFQLAVEPWITLKVAIVLAIVAAASTHGILILLVSKRRIVSLLSDQT